VRCGGNVGLDKWGPEEGSGWLMGTVESVRGGQLDDLLGQEHRGEGCNTIFFGEGPDFGMHPISPSSKH
jgi:hypothetical protein